MWRTAPLHLDDYLKLICFLSTSVYSALGVSAIMRYINRRFTYLLTLDNAGPWMENTALKKSHDRAKSSPGVTVFRPLLTFFQLRMVGP